MGDVVNFADARCEMDQHKRMQMIQEFFSEYSALEKYTFISDALGQVFFDTENPAYNYLLTYSQFIGIQPFKEAVGENGFKLFFNLLETVDSKFNFDEHVWFMKITQSTDEEVMSPNMVPGPLNVVSYEMFEDIMLNHYLKRFPEDVVCNVISLLYAVVTDLTFYDWWIFYLSTEGEELVKLHLRSDDLIIKIEFNYPALYNELKANHPLFTQVASKHS